MNNIMEIQREAIIEIVGTQYEGRAINHQPLLLQQNLILEHQSDNPHDRNAVLLLTNDGKELGFLPKGYASLYAPAIDSGRYNFTIEAVKSEPDPERPILIVKISSELKNYNEEEIETDILGFIQNIVNGYAQITTEYLTFIYSETVNVDDLLSTLNKARLIQNLYSCSSDIIEGHAIKQNSDIYTLQTKESLTRYLSELKADVSDILKKIQKSYNEALDIDDEEEYHRVQSEIRERRKKFRSYNDLLTSLLDSLTSYVNVSIKTVKNNIDTTDEAVSVVSESVQAVMTQPETKIPDSPQLTEQAFFDWLVSKGGVSNSTAKQYISNIHSIEKLYQTLFGVRRSILGAASSDNVKSMLETLVQKSEYIDANERRHNSFSSSLSKFAQFAGISIDITEVPSKRKTYQPSINSKPYVIKTVDFDDPHDCTYNKPCSFILNEIKYSIDSWHELYTKLLILLYTNNVYSEILKELNGKSLYGHHIDFADKTLLHELRKPIRVSTNFFAEGNLSAVDIIKRIKRLMELCFIDDEHMIIEYFTQDKDNDPILSQDTTHFEQLGISEDTAPALVAFNPDTTKPFDLKDALIEILMTDAPEITKYHERKGSISTKNLLELIKKYYGKSISLFEMSKLLMLDKTFQSVGKGCYILNETMISHEEAKSENAEHNISQKGEPAKFESETVQINHTPVTPEVQLTAASIVRTDENVTEDLTIESIIEVIKQNSDNLQYEDGFGAYEVKNLLSNKGINNASDKQIDALMSRCSELQEIEDGYYVLLGDDSKDNTLEQTVIMEDNSKVAEPRVSDVISMETQEITTDERNIILELNGKLISTYDYSDALNKVCEFSINCKPFKMARIATQSIQIHGNNVFYRKAESVDGYNKLSNGLQVITITMLSDLQIITAAIKKYCHIDDNMITIISK
ncbi:MAG: HIRAN domain-containing protein [Ruminococcus sp.]|nr:HIRAN domain-containing protein [Ruminococcus sp.]